MNGQESTSGLIENKGRRWSLNVTAFFCVILVNWMANALPIGGQTTGEISSKYASLFTPAGFTFSIWGVIYLSLAAFVVYQALPSRRKDAVLARIDPLFVLNCGANAAWIFVWHYDQLLLSLIVMAGILTTLVLIYRAIWSDSTSGPVSWLVRVPFSLYTAWITVASIANLSIVQTAMGWDDAGPDVIQWTLLKLAVAGSVGAVMVLRKADVAFALVIAWAAVGIASKQAGTLEVAGAASLLAGMMLLLAAYQAVRGGVSRPAAS